MKNDTLRKNHTHSIMFHHFHGSGHPTGQGAISGDDFEEMIDWLSDRYNLLSSVVYSKRLEEGALEQNDICLSFDDALLCQADIAVPILNKRDIQAFFFIYSSPFIGDPDPLEIYRYFRTVEFSDIDHFYSEFFKVAQTLYADSIDSAKMNYDAVSYLDAFPFYTKNDKWFRFLRDQVLGKAKYDEVMDSLMTHHSFDRSNASSKLWMNNDHLKSLSDAGHIVGLHSYSHPTMIQKLPVEQQEKEYTQNFEHLHSILGHNPFAMSHPCGNYSDETLVILKRLGIKIGFRSSSSITTIRSPLEIPRDDHANVMKQMKL
jgi:peptidoglycan/xylan/chitin deacetylase (PgdA/CDA1 family)